MKSQPTGHLPSDEEINAWYTQQDFDVTGELEDLLVDTPSITFAQLEKSTSLNGTLVDVRSPFEYQRDHIQSAVNIPLLNNIERHVVGNLYKKNGPSAAVQAAHLYYRQKENEFLHELLQKPEPYFIYCWRGGGRSQFVASKLFEKGYRSIRIQGGYQSYRKKVRAFYDAFPNTKIQMLVLAGLTGSGKTAILRNMSSFGPILDIEDAAQHCGSVFGHIPFSQEKKWNSVPQPLFESKLFASLNAYPRAGKPLLVEDEGGRIGFNHIPRPLYLFIRQCPRVWIDLPLKVRVQNILKDYFTDLDKQRLETNMTISINRLHKFISLDNRNKLIKWLQTQEYECFVHHMLTNYYDARYRKNPPHIIFRILASNNEDATQQLQKWLTSKDCPYEHTAHLQL